MLRQLLSIDNPRRKKDGRLARAVRCGNIDDGLLEISDAAFETQTAAGDVLALHKFFAAIGMAD